MVDPFKINITQLKLNLLESLWSVAMKIKQLAKTLV